jgi:uncharacterized protein YecE (DUF72 family)
VGEILVGICGWTEPTLIKAGTFYPPDAKTPEDRLRFYATQFPIVEVDSTYYSPPTEQNAIKWLERTPQHFTFNVKAYSLLTNHPTPPDRMPKDLRELLPPEEAEKRNVYREKLPDEVVDEFWKQFESALMPLHSAGKLGAVLFQFPQWFVISGYNKQYLVECAERLPDFRIAVEFRNKTWLEPRNQDETLAWLEDHNLPFVAVDMPQGLDSSIPPVAATTAKDLALVRFHTRDTGQFTAKGVSAAQRFAYEYRQEELEEWVPKIQDMANTARETHVLMNNCYRDYAVNNARQIGDLLDLDFGTEE